MNLLQYVQSWDGTIKRWLNNFPNCNSPMFTWANVQKDYMPEPFIGDPGCFSFVIVNLNPGAGVCHSCIYNKNAAGTLINKVATQGYSKAVNDFPYLQEEKNVGLINWNDSPGRKWWKAREKWIKHTIKMFNSSYNVNDPIPKGLCPFAMEIFPWHTQTWPTQLNNKMKSGGMYGNNVKSDVLDPLYDAIKKSKYKFAFCVGKPIGEIICSFGSSFSKLNAKPIKPLDHERYYDVYSDGKGCYIVNTWAQGENTFPGPSFYGEEKILFSKFEIL